MARWQSAGIGLFAVVGVLSCAIGLAADAFDPLSLIGQRAEIEMKSGDKLTDVEIAKVAKGRLPGTIASLTVNVGNGKRTFPATNVAKLKAGDIELAFDAELKALVNPQAPPADAKTAAGADKRKTTASKAGKKGKVEPPTETPEEAEARRKRENTERMATFRQTGVWLWPEPSEAEQQAAIAEQKAFIEKVAAKVPPGSMLLSETEHFLIFTDIPRQMVPIGEYLEAMYNLLCTKAFDLDPKKNIFRGKCSIFAFRNEMTYHSFENTFFEKSHPHTQGLCHQEGNGNVVISAFMGDNPKFFGMVLVHETAHGFVFRYKSRVNTPSWLDEGIADWIARAAVKRSPRDSTEVDERQRMAVQKVKMTRSLGGDFFTAEQITDWQYGVASSMIDMLLRPDGKSFRKFIEDVKTGMAWPEALKKNYGFPAEELATRWGLSVGVPGVRP